MAILQTTLCAVIMVTLVTSKPVSVGEDEDSSQSSESNSSEETGTHVGPSQEPLQTAFTGTDMPNAMEQTDPPDTVALHPNADSGPSPSSPNTPALPVFEDPQASADTLQFIPDDPSKTVLGIDVFQNIPESDPAVNTDTMQVLPDAESPIQPEITETDVILGTGAINEPQVTTTNTYQGFPQSATPPFPPHIIKPTSPFSTAAPMPIPISTALTGVPLCFTFQYVTSEPDPPRGDSI
ncbi:hypothetical protein Q5P01_014901 [Channa striata]|uniref:Uncharacterized protein n=1 Tax=Channa striata TaxID=64152 RepID=A0AA88MH81_CHASR|nr:hypothetical protein Q5P01_014901 [Channa striata]